MAGRIAWMFLCAVVSSRNVYTEKHDVIYTSTRDIAKRVGDKIIQNSGLFLVWDYGGALIFDGLFEVNRTFGVDFVPTLDKHLDRFITDDNSYGYKLLHGVNIPAGEAIGDDVGLFSVAYLNRIVSERKPSNCKEWKIVQAVLDRILTWQRHLADNAISRDRGWPGEKGFGASFVWADDQYMGLVLAARVAQLTTNETLARFVTKQAILLAGHLRCPYDNLYYHGYNDADGHTSCCKWGRGNGWAIMSHVEILSMLRYFPTLERENGLILDLLNLHSHALLNHQSEDGRFHQIVNETKTYLETSCTAMILTSWAKATRHGWLKRTIFHAAINQAWSGLKSTVEIDGTVNGICIGTGIQASVSDYQRRPSVYYLSGDGGLGSVLQAAVEVHRYHTWILGKKT